MQPIPKALTEYVEGLKAHDIDKIARTVSGDLAFIAATRTLDKAQASVRADLVDD